MAFPIYYQGAILFKDGFPAFSTNCCCPLCPAPFAIAFLVDLTGSAAEVVFDVDLAPFTGTASGPEAVLANRLVVVFESYCCTGTPTSIDNNNRFVYYGYYSCGNGTTELDSVFNAWVSATYGEPYVSSVAFPEIALPASNTEIDAFIEAVRNSASSGGDDALSVTYFRDLNFGCPC